jgi:acetolactate synthase-1/2/3 large subunit
METAARHNLKMVQIVLNNSVLGYQKEAEDVSYGRHTPGLHFSDVDHSLVAKACGWHSARIEKASDLLPALEAAFACDRPALIEVISDPKAWPPIQNFEGKLPPTYVD